MAQLKLTQGKYAEVDDADYERLRQYQWNASKTHRTWYARTKGVTGGRTYLHRFILNAPDGMEVDHINGDGLDNRRGNLRLCTHRENQCNQRPQKGGSSRYRGVSRANDKKRKKIWLAQIHDHGVNHYLGRYLTEEAAARAYDAAAIEYHGEFARLNFEHGEAP